VVLFADAPVSGASASHSSLDSLRVRARQMCEAWIADDLHVTYELSTPDQRRCTTEDAWVKEWRSSGDGRIVSCKISRIRRVDRNELTDVHSKCSKDPLTFQDAAVVTVKIKLRFPDGSFDKIDDMENAWLNIDGVWYWHDYHAPSLD
jgi:hypothetical protein